MALRGMLISTVGNPSEEIESESAFVQVNFGSHTTWYGIFSLVNHGEKTSSVSFRGE